MTYYGYFQTNEGTHNREAYEFTSKREATKTMRAIAWGNCLTGSSASYSVFTRSETGETKIHAGIIRHKPIR
jgi:hypothetical protein